MVPEPKGKTTLNSYIKPRGRAKETNEDSQFKKVTRNPTAKEIKILVSLLIAKATETTMENHFYSIGGDIRIQTDGGAVGSDTTGEESRLYMLIWDKTLLGKLKSLGIILDLYDRYVDDETIITRVIRKG